MTTGSLILDFAIIIAICAFTVIITRRPKPLPMNQKTKITLSSMAILTPGINLSGTSFFDPLMLPGKHELFGFPIPQLGFITYTILSLLFSAQYFKSNLTPLYNSGVFITLIATTFLAVKS